MTHTSCIQVLAKPIWVLKKTGMWSLERCTILKMIKLTIYSIFSIFAYGIVIYNIKIAIKTNNTDSLNWMISVLLPLTNYYSKGIALFTRKSYLRSILDDLQSDAFNMQNKELNRHIESVHKISKMLYRYFSIAMMAFLAMFSVLPAIVDIGIMMIPASFNIGKYDKPYRIWHMFYTCFIAYNSAAYDTLYMTLIYFGAAQINILEERLKNLYEDTIKISSGFQYSKTQECVSRKILRECIVLHNLINR